MERREVMELIVHILKAIVYLYFGFGIGHNLSKFKDKPKLYLRKGSGVKQVTGVGLAMFILITTLLWPLYFNMKFRETFMLSARWQ